MSIFNKMFSRPPVSPKSKTNTSAPESGDFSPGDIGTLICIPGPWKDRSDFVRTVASASEGKFLFTGLIMVETEEKRHVELDFYEYDPKMVQTFEHTGRGLITAESLEKITAHKSTVYLHFETGILEHLEKLRAFTTFIRDIGGIAVKIESVGIAHEWDRWFEILNNNFSFEIYSNFVYLTGDDTSYYSFGMKHFDLPDCRVPRDLPIEEASELMNQFNFYQISENPVMKTGQTFSVNESATKFRLFLTADDRDPSDSPFYNPQGIWILKVI